jgi:hypothetical protein
MPIVLTVCTRNFLVLVLVVVPVPMVFPLMASTVKLTGYCAYLFPWVHDVLMH